MALSIDDLFTTVTADQNVETYLTILETMGIKARSWRPGGVARTILRVIAMISSDLTQILVKFIKAGFLESAEGPWLTLLARNVFGVERVAATFATGTVTLTNTGGGIFDYNPGEVQVLWTAGNKLYVNTEAFHLGVGGSVDVEFQALEAGAASSVPAGGIDALQTTLLGVMVTNATALVGLDEQSDDELRTECENKLASLSPFGPRGAYRYAVQSAKRMDGTPVNVNRFEISIPDGITSTGIITLWLASPSGEPDGADVTAVADRIEEVARPDGITVNVDSASAVTVSRSLVIWALAKTGLTTTIIENAVNAATTAYIQDYPVGGIAKPPSTQGYWWASGLEGVCKGAHPQIFAVDGAGADVALANGEVATLSTTLDVRIVNP